VEYFCRYINLHELTFRYRTFSNDKEEYIIRNGYKFAVGFGVSEKWCFRKIPTFLQKGINEITLKESRGNIDIDFLEIAPVDIKSTVKPLHNIFYRRSPRDLFFKINRYDHQIESVTCGGHNVRYELSDFPFYEDAVVLRIPQEEIIKFDGENNIFEINFSSGYFIDISVKLVETRKPAELTIVAPDINHGGSVLMILPTGKTLLIDCGEGWARDSILIPLLHRNGISNIDYFIITHYHSDHDGGDKGKIIKDLFHVGKFWDYRSFRSGDEFDLEETHIKILNSYEDGDKENTRSISFRMEYNGFVYQHGGDTYHTNQQNIMNRFPNDVEADVFCANHHFHGSIDTSYVRIMNPVIVIVQAEQAIYARSAYMEIFKGHIERYFIENKKRYIEDLPTFEVRTVVIRVNSKSDWTYETVNTGVERIPYLND
jgi:hypothetical protein